MKTKILTSILFVIFISVGALAQDQIAGRDWKLTYLRSVKIGSVRASISIDPHSGRFSGNTGCNIANGTADIRSNSIKFTTMITTKRACTMVTAPVESSMLSALNEANRFQVSRYRLRIYDRNRLLMEFEAVAKAKPDDDIKPVAGQFGLEERKWVLESIAGSPIPKVEKLAFINFDAAKGSAGGDTSCNAFGGDYKTDGNRFSFTHGISTMRACIEDERMNIERQFLDGLRDANRYEIKRDNLILYHDRKLLLTFRGTAK